MNNDDFRFQGAGGTSGGIGEFLFGLLLVVVGGYLFLNQVTVSSTYWYLGGYNAFGVTMIPLLLGIGLLFFNGKSAPGWALVVLGVLVIMVGVIAHLDVYFRPTTLYNTLFMLGMLAAGVGLISRSLKSH